MRRAFGHGAIEDFLSGKPILVRGVLYDYRADKSGSAVRQTIRPDGTHVPYRLDIRTKAGECAAADACVYFQDTPVIDQLIALALHVQHLDGEMELLRRTNMQGMVDPGLRDNKGMRYRPSAARLAA